MNMLHRFRRTKTAKVLLAFIAFIAVLYLILFSLWGNRLMSPIVEKALSSGFSTPMNVQEFTLRHNRFHMIAQDDFGNTLSTQGGFSLLTLRLYAHYRLECFRADGMNPMRVPFKTVGAFSGGIGAFNIRGNATIFGGDILYKIELHRFHLSQLDLIIDQIDYEPMMHYQDYPSDTDTQLSGTVDLRGLDRRDVMGTIYLSTQTKRFSPTPIHEDDNSTFNLKSLLADKFGQIKPFDVNVALDASLEHAGILEQFVGLPLAGALSAQGTLSGDKTLLKFKASSDVARSNTKFTVIIPDLEPSSILLDLRNADAQQTFELFALPAPITGQISAYAELNATAGTLQTTIRKGSTIPDILQQHYRITQPLIHFDADVNADISEKGVHYRASFKSDLNRMDIDNTTAHDQMLRELLKTLR